MIKPFFETLSNRHTDVQFLKLDVDKVPDAANEVGLRVMPTFVVFKNGTKINDLEGADQRSLVDLVKKYSKIPPSQKDSDNTDNNKNNNNNSNYNQNNSKSSNQDIQRSKEKSNKKCCIIL
jgi:thioredoxin-like negative regulator of GroEL